MSTIVSVKATTRSAQADLLARNLDGGYVKIYAGTPPADVDTALSGNTLLGTLGINATSAPAASSGTLTFNAITDDTSADATGIATFYRTYRTDGTTAETQGSVGTSGTSMVLADTSIITGGTISITSVSLMLCLDPAL